MKPRERVVQYYDLCVTSETREADIEKAAGASLDELLEAFYEKNEWKDFLIMNGAKRQIHLADWSFDKSRRIHKLLINHTDADTSDVAFRNLKTKKIREAGKTKEEGLLRSMHVVIKTENNSNSASAVMTMGSGANYMSVQKLFRKLSRELKSSETHEHLFKFNHPSAVRNDDGEMEKYSVNYNFECMAHMGTTLQDALTKGVFVGMDLIRYGGGGFDSGGNFSIVSQSISVEMLRPEGQSKLKSFIASYTKNQAYDEAKIKYKPDSGKEQSVTLQCQNLDAAFTRRDLLTFETDLDDKQTSLHPEIIDSMVELL